MTTPREDIVKQLDRLLNHKKQMWFLGAGISKNAGVPLMYTLTDQIEERLNDQHKNDFRTMRERLHDDAHVEHVLNRIGNLMGIAEESRDPTVQFGDERRGTDNLQELYRAIQNEIQYVIRWGYRDAEDGGEPEVGEPGRSLITVEHHCQFIDALFHHRRAGLEHRSPIPIFTTNYDTLLEDALALCRVPTADGFAGGAMAFWYPNNPSTAFTKPFSRIGGIEAKLYKLHGSVDWYESPEEIVVRRRDGVRYPLETASRLLIYPQATKFRMTQQPPFEQLFSAFRGALADPSEGILCICGYGFGDKHVNNRIESAMKIAGNQLTVIAFAKERQSGDGPDGPACDSRQLPAVLESWLNRDEAWTERLIVVTDSGFYHGQARNLLPDDCGWELWSFEGLTEFLRFGPDAIANDNV